MSALIWSHHAGDVELLEDTVMSMPLVEIRGTYSAAAVLEGDDDRAGLILTTNEAVDLARAILERYGATS